jgi:hypothetical protein
MSNFNKTILIVCEGTGTEPKYFQELYNQLIDKGTEVQITIRPRPPESDAGNGYEQRKGSKKRALVLTEDEKKENSLVEDEYKAQPVAYVREAQLGLIDNTFEETWAIFDKDGHPKHKEAFELADIDHDGSCVNIGISCIAFEFWILLHFENSTVPFQRAMCRSVNPAGKKEYYFCGNNEHASDCGGDNCVCGRIVSQNYSSYTKRKKDFAFDSYHPHVNNAIERAIELKKTYAGNPNPIYDLNPITTVYRLVFKLLHLTNIDFTWFELDETQFIDDYKIEIQKVESNLEIKIELTQIKTKIIHKDLICLFDITGKPKELMQRTVIGRTNEDNILVTNYNIDDCEDFVPIFIGYKIMNNSFCISEL